MTFADLLSQIPGMTDADAKGYALVFGDEAHAQFIEIQQTQAEAQHQATPVQLTDGRWLLCADLLLEIGPNGLFADGFALLPPALFEAVEVVPWEEVVPLVVTREDIL